MTNFLQLLAMPDWVADGAAVLPLSFVAVTLPSLVLLEVVRRGWDGF